MLLTFCAYVNVQREDGRNVYVCQSLRGPHVTASDPLLASALAKLGNKMRKLATSWIKDGKASRISDWLYETDVQTRVQKLVLILRDRTVRCKLLLVASPAFNRHVVFSPSIPEVAFEVGSLSELESRATDVYTSWAQKVLSRDKAEEQPDLSDLDRQGDMWLEPVEVDIEATIQSKKKSKNLFAALFGGEKMSGGEELHKVGHCLDEVADEFEPALGRTEIVDEVEQILAREDRQGVLIVGPPSVGKTAIVQEFAKRRAARFQRDRGSKPQVWWLSPQRLISGMSYLGQWEQRWLAILREAVRRDHVLYFDDLVGLFTAGRTRDSSLSAADVLRSFLSENRVRILAEVTDEQLAILRRRDRSLADRFHILFVPSLSSEDALPILLESSYNLEAQSERFFHPETIPMIMRHQEIFAPNLAFPGKAIEMSKALVKHSADAVDLSVFYRLAGTQVGANLALLLGRLGNLDDIRKTLAQQLIGQPEAIHALSRVVVRYAQHLQAPDRPLGVLLFLGPTGVGKTESAKALTRLLYNDDSHLIRFDMNELTTPYAAEQLVGTFDQPEGRLTSAIRRQPNCVILLDEIEKAHPDVFDYLLQVIGEGRLTDARGRVTDFRSSIIIMTSNLGASEQRSSMGFDTSQEHQTQLYTKAAQSFFRPEFFNRMDGVVAFRSLNAEDMEKIVQIQMSEVLSRDGLLRRDVYVNVTDAAIRSVVKTGFDSQLGARAVRRMLEREVIGPLGDCLASMSLDSPALIRVTETDQALTCNVTELQTVTTQPRKRIEDLQRLVDVGEPLYRELDQRLSDIADDLRVADESHREKVHNASYYALREHVYRCSELLKVGKDRLIQKKEPRLDVSTSPTARPLRDWDGSSSRRKMRDWQAQQEVHAAIADNRGHDLESLTTSEICRQLTDSFSTASAMIQFAAAPRDFAIGFQTITGQPYSSNRSENAKKKLGHEYEILDAIGGPQEFLTRLANCLRYRWHYEVAACNYPISFWRASGVSLLGILKPLLGTYCAEPKNQPRHLTVLRAIELPHDAGDDEVSGRIDEALLATDIRAIPKGSEQELPLTQIRGRIGQQVVDFVSGASIQFSNEDWFRSEKVASRLMTWWLDCLPIPSALLEE